MKKLLLVDGNSMLFRAYWATAYGNRMSAPDGTPTNAVFGFSNMLVKALETVRPDAILVAFDAGRHTFRHELYPAYKGTRQPAPDDLVPQFQLVRGFLDSFGIRWVEEPDIEADDLIGTMSKNTPEYQTFILSSDHDLLQLVDDETTVLLMKKGMTEIEEMTPAHLKESMGIEPLQIIDMKGLMGDSSDNIPGVKGIGEKTAVKLLAQYGSVEGVLEHENEIKGAMGNKIREGHDSALLSKKLATIKTDVDLSFTADECAFSPDFDGVERYFRTLAMNCSIRRYQTYAKTLPARHAAPVTQEIPALSLSEIPVSRNEIQTAEAGDETLLYTPQEVTVSAADTEEVFAEYVTRMPSEILKEETAVFIDTEPGSYRRAAMRSLTISDGSRTYDISVEDLKKDEALLDYLKAETPHKCGFDIKRSMHVLARAGIVVNFFDDTMIMAALVNSTLTSTEKIFDSFGLTLTKTADEVYGRPSKPLLVTDENDILRYRSENAANILKLKAMTGLKLKEFGMEDLYRKIEMPLVPVLAAMEDEGIRCDTAILDEIAVETRNRMDGEAAAVAAIAGHEFNLNSPKQVAEVLYDEMGLPTGKKRSTAVEELEKFAGEYEIVDHILQYRKWSKLYSTYAEGLKKYVEQDGKIHTTYNQCATQTGRLSSSEPNMQNISVRDEDARLIRKAFLPEDGCVLISSDYHQIELRMLAHMADEQGLIDAFNRNIDIHTKTAMDVFHKTQEEVTPADRRQAKTVNFGIVYGISDFGLAQQLGVSRKEAAAFKDAYYKAYPRIRTYMQQVIKDCEKNGYVETLCHRRREIPEISNRNFQMREFGKRAAMNAPIQGTAADLIKIAMINIQKAMEEAKVKSRMILQVHDELIFNVPEEEKEQMVQIIEKGMVSAMKLKVPLTAETAVGKTWYEAK